VPDFYQGTELWDLSLVDPDNRRPVDFDARAAWLAELQERGRDDRQSLGRELFEQWPDGRIKLYVTHLGLLLRRGHADLFADGEYLPLEVVGVHPSHVCAFARRLRDRWVLVVAPRLCARLAATADASTEQPAPLAERQDVGGARTEATQVDPGIRLPALRAPVGPAIWRNTRLVLPGGAAERWRNVFTGEEVASAAGGAEPATLALGSVLREFPVAMLVAQTNAAGD
jgi:(1->4)-alpha-D-glucan 1-alpha-D-glucosylmutase